MEINNAKAYTTYKKMNSVRNSSLQSHIQIVFLTEALKTVLLYRSCTSIHDVLSKTLGSSYTKMLTVSFYNSEMSYFNYLNYLHCSGNCPRLYY